MKYELSEVGPCRKKIVLQFSAEDIDNAFAESYREINGYVQIKGFRKGHAPLRTLEKRFGEEASDGARRSLTDKHLNDVIKETDLEILGGVTDKTVGKPIPRQPYNIEIELDVMPEFELPAYTGFELEAQPKEVTDAEVEETLERYQKIFANYTPVEGEAADGDVLKVDFVARVDGEEVMNMKEQRLRIEGDKLFGLPCADLVQKFTGAKAGDTVELSINMPEDHPNADLRNKPASIEVSVAGVERGELPALDDAFASNLGMNSLKDFRDHIRANLARDAMVEARTLQEKQVMQKIIGEVDFPVPQGMIDSETDALLDQQRARMQRGGVPADQMDARVEEFRAEAAKTAEEKVRWGMIATRIGKKENITVSNDDLAAQIEALAQAYNTTPAKIIQRVREFDGVGPMMQEILSIKVMQFIVDSAKGGRLDPDKKEDNSGAANADAANTAAGEGNE
jgi:trigger factor